MEYEEIMERDPAIVIQGLRKQYRLGMIGGGTLKHELESWWAKKRGKEDPNLPLGINKNNIGKKFYALDDIDLTIYKGETVGIIGINGAGKSTLLKLLSRVTSPTEGEIDIYGRVTSMLEVGTGFHKEMTGRENIYLNGAILGMSRCEIDERIDAIIEFSEIGEFIDTPVKRYSSGMFVKLAFSVATHLDSEIMIMDEVLAVGDMAFQQKCLNRMHENAVVDGRTVLYVSHNMNTIRRLCSRCIVLNKGKIIFDGNVNDAISIYMNHTIGDNELDYDLTKVPHAKVTNDHILNMKHLRLLNKISPIYQSNELLELALTIQVKKPIRQVQVRLTLRTETDEGLGTAWSKPIDLEECKDNTYRLRCNMDLSILAKGTFYASIGIYQKDEIGRMITLDHVTRAFRIEVTGQPNWNSNAHGYIQLPKMEVIISS